MIDVGILYKYLHDGDIRHAVCPSPAGELFLLGTDTFLKAVIFKKSFTGSVEIERHVPEGTTSSIAGARALLNAYFSLLSRRQRDGKSKQTHAFLKNSALCLEKGDTRVVLDLAPFTLKEIAIYRALMAIPFGRTVSYSSLAEQAGIPGGARFAGNTMAKNIFPILIPCHRVIRSDGTIGNYSSGTDIKEYLLSHE
ncbi:MAG: MGMT family protein [Spirochaetes bacterium]|nr:MGMT family protein [Spirochaetota bacterium]